MTVPFPSRPSMSPVSAGDVIGATSTRPSNSHQRRAFTIAEIIVALVITGFLALATSIAVSQTVRARDASVARVEAHMRAETAASRIAADVENAVRDPEVIFTRLLIVNRASGADMDEILLFTRSLRLVRPRAEQGEGGEYECQYRLQPAAPGAIGGIAMSGAQANSYQPVYSLWRRADPVPDEYPDAGGVAAAIVTGMASLSIRAYNGSSWLDSWDSDRDGYPHAVVITAVATDNSGRYSATARRLVALDRTPIPEVPVVIEDDSATTTSSTGQR